MTRCRQVATCFEELSVYPDVFLAKEVYGSPLLSGFPRLCGLTPRLPSSCGHAGRYIRPDACGQIQNAELHPIGMGDVFCLLVPVLYRTRERERLSSGVSFCFQMPNTTSAGVYGSVQDCIVEPLLLEPLSPVHGIDI